MEDGKDNLNATYDFDSNVTEEVKTVLYTFEDSFTSVTNRKGGDESGLDTLPEVCVPRMNMVEHKSFWEKQFIHKDVNKPVTSHVSAMTDESILHTSADISETEASSLKRNIAPKILKNWYPFLSKLGELGIRGISLDGDVIACKIQHRHTMTHFSNEDGIGFQLFGTASKHDRLPKHIYRHFRIGIPYYFRILCSDWIKFISEGSPSNFKWSEDLEYENDNQQQSDQSSMNSYETTGNRKVDVYKKHVTSTKRNALDSFTNSDSVGRYNPANFSENKQKVKDKPVTPVRAIGYQEIVSPQNYTQDFNRLSDFNGKYSTPLHAIGRGSLSSSTVSRERDSDRSISSSIERKIARLQAMLAVTKERESMTDDSLISEIQINKVARSNKEPEKYNTRDINEENEQRTYLKPNLTFKAPGPIGSYKNVRKKRLYNEPKYIDFQTKAPDFLAKKYQNDSSSELNCKKIVGMNSDQKKASIVLEDARIHFPDTETEAENYFELSMQKISEKRMDNLYTCNNNRKEKFKKVPNYVEYLNIRSQPSEDAQNRNVKSHNIAQIKNEQIFVTHVKGRSEHFRSLNKQKNLQMEETQVPQNVTESIILRKNMKNISQNLNECGRNRTIIETEVNDSSDPEDQNNIKTVVQNHSKNIHSLNKKYSPELEGIDLLNEVMIHNASTSNLNILSKKIIDTEAEADIFEELQDTKKHSKSIKSVLRNLMKQIENRQKFTKSETVVDKNINLRSVHEETAGVTETDTDEIFQDNSKQFRNTQNSIIPPKVQHKKKLFLESESDNESFNDEIIFNAKKSQNIKKNPQKSSHNLHKREISETEADSDFDDRNNFQNAKKSVRDGTYARNKDNDGDSEINVESHDEEKLDYYKNYQDMPRNPSENGIFDPGKKSAIKKITQNSKSSVVDSKNIDETVTDIDSVGSRKEYQHSEKFARNSNVRNVSKKNITCDEKIVDNIKNNETILQNRSLKSRKSKNTSKKLNTEENNSIKVNTNNYSNNEVQTKNSKRTVRKSADKLSKHKESFQLETETDDFIDAREDKGTQTDSDDNYPDDHKNNKSNPNTKKVVRKSTRNLSANKRYSTKPELNKSNDKKILKNKNLKSVTRNKSVELENETDQYIQNYEKQSICNRTQKLEENKKYTEVNKKTVGRKSQDVNLDTDSKNKNVKTPIDQVDRTKNVAQITKKNTRKSKSLSSHNLKSHSKENHVANSGEDSCNSKFIDNKENDGGNINFTKNSKETEQTVTVQTDKVSKTLHSPRKRKNESNVEESTLENFNKSSQPQFESRLNQVTMYLKNWRPDVTKKMKKWTYKIVGDIVDVNGRILNKNHKTQKIDERFTNRTYRAKDSIVYILIGGIYDPKNDIPLPLKNILQHGLPPKWFEETCLLHKRTGNKQEKKKDHPESVAPVQKQQKTKEPENDTDVSNSINEPKVIETTFMHNDTMNSTISRFGRNCRPPLKYWQGERVLHIGDQTIYQPPNLNDDIKKLDASTRSSKSVKVNSASVQKRKVEASTKEEKYETKLIKKEKKEQEKKSQVKNADNINTQKLNTSPKRLKGRASKSEAKSKISEFLMNNKKLVKRNYPGNDIISNDKLKKLKELRICLTDILVEKLAEDLESKGKPEAKKRRISVRSSRVLSSRYPKNYNLRQIRNKVKNKKKNLNKSESVDSGYVCSPVFGKNKMCYVLLERMNSSLQSKKPEQKKHDITRVISKNIEKRVKKNINRKKQLKKILSATDLQMLIMKKRRSLNAKAVFVQQSKNKIDEMETDSQVTSPVTSQSSDETILRIPKKRKLYNESEWMAEIAEMDIN